MEGCIVFLFGCQLLSYRLEQLRWHNRLGHPHSRVLRSILCQCPVDGSTSFHSHLCVACQQGKSSRIMLSRTLPSSLAVLDLVYTNI